MTSGVGDRVAAVGEARPRRPRCSRPNSVISRPARPLVIAAIGIDVDLGCRRARGAAMKSTSATSSITGSVSGIMTIVVTPPAAAAWLAEAKVSRCSRAGLADEDAHVDQAGQRRSRRVQSMTSAPSGAPWFVPPPAGGDDAAVGDDHRAGLVEAARGIDDAGVLEDDRRGRASSCSHELADRHSCVRQVRGEGFEHRHAHGDAHLDLLVDDALRAVGDLPRRSRRRGSSGPGCMTSASGLAQASFSASRPKKRKYSRTEGTKAPAMRSRCRRSIITTSAPSRPSRMSVKTSTPMPLDAGRQQRRGRRRRAPARPAR